MKQIQGKRTRDPVEEKWKEVVDKIMEEKLDIGIDKLLRRGVKRMRKMDPRPDAVLREELRNVINFGCLEDYSLYEDQRRMKKVNVNVLQDQRAQQMPEPQEEAQERPKPQDMQPTQQQTQPASQRIPISSAEPDTWRGSLKRINVKTGKFSKSEEDTLRSAVIEFARSNGHSTTDLSWIIGKKEYSGKESRGIWTEVARSLPQRTIKSVAAAGVRMFHPYANKGAWTPNEDALLLALVDSQGKKWTKISQEMERTPEACRLRWREIHAEELKSGKWEKDEENRLIEAVRECGDPRSLKGNSTIPKLDSQGNVIAVPDRRMILDDVNWEAVVRHVKTRSRIQCVKKWYLRLSPTMQDRGEWDKPDDKTMLKALWEEKKRLNNLMEHEVIWDSLVPGRSADQCKRRWALMRKAIKGQKNFEFSELIAELVKILLPKEFEKSNEV